MQQLLEHVHGMGQSPPHHNLSVIWPASTGIGQSPNTTEKTPGPQLRWSNGCTCVLQGHSPRRKQSESKGSAGLICCKNMSKATLAEVMNMLSIQASVHRCTGAIRRCCEYHHQAENVERAHVCFSHSREVGTQRLLLMFKLIVLPAVAHASSSQLFAEPSALP